MGSRAHLHEMGCEPLILNEFRHTLIRKAEGLPYSLTMPSAFQDLSEEHQRV
jgi:hypothetical protein